MKSVSYTSSQTLACSCGGAVVLCVDPTLTLTGAPYIEATAATINYNLDCHGRQLYTFGFLYEEGQLKDIDVGLIEENIQGVVCRGCMTSYVDWLTGVGNNILSWTPTVSLVQDIFCAGGVITNLVTNTRYSVSQAGKLVTIFGNISFTLTGCSTGVRFTLPVPINNLYQCDSGASKYSATFVNPIPEAAVLEMYEDTGISYGRIATGNVSNTDWVFKFNGIYEAA